MINGPYHLQLNGPWFTKSRIQKGFGRLRIDPQGDDTWRFSIVVELMFEDGTSIYHKPTYNIELSDERREFFMDTESGEKRVNNPWEGVPRWD